MYISVKEALKRLADGKMLVVIDAKDRENEGDIIFAAQHSSEEMVNFLISKAKGVLCVSVSEELAKKFGLKLMVAQNESNHCTAFTVTVDAKEATTGVSVHERNMSIKLFGEDTTCADDFVRPGHINPLIAKKGGVLERTGHTEASVDLCRLAGLKSACVICEIVKDDGDMARESDLLEFCKKYDLGMIAIEDLIKYRLQNESLVRLNESKSAKILGFDCKKLSFTDHNQNEHFIYQFGEIKPCENVKFHLSMQDFALLESLKYEELQDAIKVLASKGGVLCVMQNQNPTGIKNYGVGAQILRNLGIKQIRLLSKNEAKEYALLGGFGLDVGVFE